MNKSKQWLEEYISQIPALQLLQQMGYEYLNPSEVLELRNNKYNNVILESILTEQLKKINSIQFKGKLHEFSEADIQKAVRRIKNVSITNGLVNTSEAIYDLLTFSMSIEKTIEGDKKSYSIKYIDWENPENNVFHVTDEFEVEKVKSHELRRPDIVIFINGLPLVVIENKRPSANAQGESSVWQGVSQMIRNQRENEIPNLFIYSQLLLSVNVVEALYATTATDKKFWSLWHEENAKEHDKIVADLINRKPSPKQWDDLFNHRDSQTKQNFKKQEKRLATVQDNTIYSLLSKERLLQMISYYIVFDGGIKKITRYQQFFAIQETLNRVRHLTKQGKRNGGVIWHTTGSGKSLTMVMLAKALAMEPSIRNPKVILVTDRVDLDDQLFKVFQSCGKQPIRARSGKHLIEMIKNKEDAIITTVIDKFETVADKGKVIDENPNVFLLIDESHRSQYGSTNAKMQMVFPMACYIGFTGTPLLKSEKNTAIKFGGIIHKYSINQAVKDKTVVPLMYEARMVVTEIDKKSVDVWFDRVTSNLTKEQKKDLKAKFSRMEVINKAEQRIKQIAYDISNHFTQNNYRQRGFKAQLATSSKYVAILYKKYLDEFELVTSDVIISAPDTREDNNSVDESDIPLVHQFWNKMMTRFQSESKYIKGIIEPFKAGDDPDIIIVVDKLLTGFDAPRNKILYIDKNLKEHSLLQAIARVNRLFENKENGYIIDYRGILGELDTALNTYSALENFEEDDIDGTIISIKEEVDKLQQRHSDLLAHFNCINNKSDIQEYINYLKDDEKIRLEFYELLSAFAKSLKVALSSIDFLSNTEEEYIAKYKDDLKYFHNLRVNIKSICSETINYKEYESQIQALINTHIQANEIMKLTELISIFDKEAFEKELANLESKSARADTIASRTKAVINEKWDEDPAFYKKFSKLIEESIEDYQQLRITDAEFLSQMQSISNSVIEKDESDLPDVLIGHENASVYYRTVNEILQATDTDIDFLAELGLKLDNIIENKQIVNWVNNKNIQNEMMNNIEDYLFNLKGRNQLDISDEIIDDIIEQIMDIARKRSM